MSEHIEYLGTFKSLRRRKLWQQAFSAYRQSRSPGGWGSLWNTPEGQRSYVCRVRGKEYVVLGSHYWSILAVYRIRDDKVVREIKRWRWPRELKRGQRPSRSQGAGTPWTYDPNDPNRRPSPGYPPDHPVQSADR